MKSMQEIFERAGKLDEAVGASIVDRMAAAMLSAPKLEVLATRVFDDESQRQMFDGMITEPLRALIAKALDAAGATVSGGLLAKAGREMKGVARGGMGEDIEEMVSMLSDDELIALDEDLIEPEEALEWMLQERHRGPARPKRTGYGSSDLGKWVDREKYQKSVHKGVPTRDLEKNIHSKSKELKHLARKEMAFRAQHGQSGPSKSTKAMCKQGEKMVFGTCRKIG